MVFQLRSHAKYAIACLTSMGVRITPANRMPSHNSTTFTLSSTSAETNVLNVASSLGCECLALTKFVEGSPIAAFIKAQLRARGIAYEGKDVPQGGPWGYRHQFNIADSGFGLRAPRVWNDRAGEVGCTLSAEDFDVERIFGEEGVAILHLSGLIAAMMEKMVDTNTAKQHGNYFTMPNAIYDLGLSSGAIATYGFLVRLENRKHGDKDEHTCYPSQTTIGEAIARDRKTVGKYIEELCEAGLISIEPTMVTTADGQRWNGNLKYTLLDP